MKKLFAFLLAAMLMVTMTACSGKTETPADDNNNQNAGSKETDKSALELLNRVWESYTEDEKFPAAGGDMSEENMTMGAPGKFGITDAEALNTTLGFPAASADKIDEAASLMHMMNANTFTCGAFHVKEVGDMADLSAAIKDNIMKRQWLCGFPDKLVIMKADNYLITFFGENEIVDTFKAKLAAACTSAETVCDEPIA